MCPLALSALDFNQALNLSWLYYALMVVYSVTVAGIIVVVLSENRSPVKSLAWVTVLFLMPLLGVILYVFFGRSIKNTRMISRRNRRRLRKQQDSARLKNNGLASLKPESAQLVKLTRMLSGSNIYTASSIRVFTSGHDKFEALLADIENAKYYINVQYYIIEKDGIGSRLKDALIRKARQGVTVRVIYDHVGSFKAPNSFFREMRDEGIQVYPFFKVVFPPFGTRINWRNHRKICIIDGSIGYIGGMNVGDRYIDGGKFGVWRDTHIRITGQAVNALQFSFAVDWNFMGQPLIDDMRQPAPDPSPTDKPILQIVTSGPTSQWSNVALLFISAIASAKQCIYIQTPYFLPTEGLLKALQAAALSGVDVRVMMPRLSDSKMLTAASASYIEECLRAGIKIYFYNPGMLHAKTILVDDEFVSIGSTNFDFRSFEHNFEANMQIYSRDFNAHMADLFVKDITDCTRIIQSEWRRRPLPKKIAESITRLFSPIL